MNTRCILMIVAIVWFLVAGATIWDRAPYACGPLLETHCLLIGWGWLGDIATFAWVDDWETLVGSFVALAAALIGLAAVRGQMRQGDVIAERQRAQAEEHVREARRRRLLGLRAGLPLALSSASSHLSQVAKDMRSLHDSVRTGQGHVFSGHVTSHLPDDIVPSLQAIVELEDDGRVRDRMVALAWDCQEFCAGGRFFVRGRSVLRRRQRTASWPRSTRAEGVSIPRSRG